MLARAAVSEAEAETTGVVLCSWYGEPIYRYEVDTDVSTKASGAGVGNDLYRIAASKVRVDRHGAHNRPSMSGEECCDPLHGHTNLSGPYCTGMAAGLCIGVQCPV